MSKTKTRKRVMLQMIRKKKVVEWQLAKGAKKKLKSVEKQKVAIKRFSSNFQLFKEL